MCRLDPSSLPKLCPPSVGTSRRTSSGVPFSAGTRRSRKAALASGSRPVDIETSHFVEYKLSSSVEPKPSRHFAGVWVRMAWPTFRRPAHLNKAGELGDRGHASEDGVLGRRHPRIPFVSCYIRPRCRILLVTNLVESVDIFIFLSRVDPVISRQEIAGFIRQESSIIAVGKNHRFHILKERVSARYAQTRRNETQGLYQGEGYWRDIYT